MEESVKIKLSECRMLMKSYGKRLESLRRSL